MDFFQVPADFIRDPQAAWACSKKVIAEMSPISQRVAPKASAKAARNGPTTKPAKLLLF
jgi:hypothetical protein